MKLMDDFRERAEELKADLHEHGTTIAAAVRTNSIAVLLVALMSGVAIILGITALRKATR